MASVLRESTNSHLGTLSSPSLGWTKIPLIVLAIICLGPTVVQADTTAGKKKAQLCLVCHMNNAYFFNNEHFPVPTLDGQPSEYLYRQLKAFKEKRRGVAPMQTSATALSEKDMRDLADYFASRPPLRGKFRLDPAKVSKGKKIASEQKCTQCHNNDFPSKTDIPHLAGMQPTYVTSEIVSFTKGLRRHPRINRDSKLSYDDAIALGQYFAQRE